MSLNDPLKQKPSDDSPNWRAFFDDTIVPFWDTKVESKYFKGDDGLTLHYASYKHTPEAPLVVISPGRIESALKYQNYSGSWHSTDSQSLLSTTEDRVCRTV